VARDVGNDVVATDRNASAGDGLYGVLGNQVLEYLGIAFAPGGSARLFERHEIGRHVAPVGPRSLQGKRAGPE